MRTILFVRENFRWIGGAFLLTLFSAFGQAYFISLSAGHIRQEFGLTHGSFGLVFMAATLTSAATLPFLGRIVDFYPTRRVILIIVPGLAAACLAMALNHSVLVLFIAIYALRLFGQGMMMQTAATATARWFVANRGRAMALALLGYNTGEAVFPLLFVETAAAAGWRGAWMMAAFLLVSLALPVSVALLRVERTPRASDPGSRLPPVPDRTRSEVVRDPLFYIMLTGILAPPFIGTSILFHQVHLAELRGWPLEMFASSFMVLALMNIVFVMITGYLVDRVSAIRLLPVFLLPLALGCFVLGIFDAPWSPFLFMGLLGLAFGIHSTLFGAVWPEIYGLKHLGAIRAVVVSVMVLFTAVGPGLTGILIDAGVSFPHQVMGMGFYCLAAMVVMIVVSRRLSARQLETPRTTE